MSSTAAAAGPFQREADRPRERRLGSWGMWLFIATEGMLFVMLFFAYIYMGSSARQWPLEEDPSYRYALILLGILLLSSVVAHWGQRGIESGGQGRLKLGLVGTLALGGVFIWVQIIEYRNHLQVLRPGDSGYASIFYTITSFHFLHLIAGLLMLLFITVRAFAGHFSEQRHLAVKNVTMYWHFVDVVWLFVVAILYISPQFYGPPFLGPSPT